MRTSSQDAGYSAQLWTAIALAAMLVIVAVAYLWIQDGPTVQRSQHVPIGAGIPDPSH